jgi:hypothetical protein
MSDMQQHPSPLLGQPGKEACIRLRPWFLVHCALDASARLFNNMSQMFPSNCQVDSFIRLQNRLITIQNVSKTCIGTRIFALLGFSSNPGQLARPPTGLMMPFAITYYD